MPAAYGPAYRASGGVAMQCDQNDVVDKLLTVQGWRIGGIAAVCSVFELTDPFERQRGVLKEWEKRLVYLGNPRVVRGQVVF